MSDLKFALILAAIVLSSVIMIEPIADQAETEKSVQRAIKQESECNYIKPGYTDCHIISTTETKL